MLQKGYPLYYILSACYSPFYKHPCVYSITEYLTVMIDRMKIWSFMKGSFVEKYNKEDIKLI